MELGRQVKYGIGKGDDAAVTQWLNQLSFEFNPKALYVNNESAYGVLEKTKSATVLRQWAEGSLEHKLTSDSSGLILLGAFGSVATADNADSNASVKDHTFTLTQDIAGQLFTLVRKDSLSTMKHTFTRFGEWSLKMELDKYISFTAAVMARKGSSTTATPAFTEETEFVPKHMTVKTASTEAGLSGASAISALEKFSINVNPNISPDWESGNADPYGFSSDGYDLAFEMTCRYTDTTYEDAYKNGTALAMQIAAENTDVVIGAAAHPKLVLTATRMNINDWTKNEDLNAKITQTMKGVIHFSPADSKSLVGVLTNTTTGY